MDWLKISLSLLGSRLVGKLWEIRQKTCCATLELHHAAANLHLARPTCPDQNPKKAPREVRQISFLMQIKCKMSNVKLYARLYSFTCLFSGLFSKFYGVSYYTVSRWPQSRNTGWSLHVKPSEMVVVAYDPNNQVQASRMWPSLPTNRMLSSDTL